MRRKGNDERHQGGRAVAMVGELAILFVKKQGRPLICNDDRSPARFLLLDGRNRLELYAVD